MTTQEKRLSVAVNKIAMEGLKPLNEVSDGLEYHYEMAGELRREILYDAILGSVTRPVLLSYHSRLTDDPG